MISIIATWQVVHHPIPSKELIDLKNVLQDQISIFRHICWCINWSVFIMLKILYQMVKTQIFRHKMAPDTLERKENYY